MSTNLRWLLALLSGVLLGLSFPPLPFSWLAWIAFVPLLKSLEGSDWRAAAEMTLAAHLVAFVLAGHWVLLHPDPYTRMASAAGIVWLAILGASPWFIASRLKSSLRRDLSILAGVGTLDMLHLHTQLGFPWLLIGHTQAGFEPFNQMAELGGVTLLSVWVVTVNLMAERLLNVAGRKKLKPAIALLVVILVTLLVGSWRLWRTASDQQPEQPEVVEVLGIQPALPVDLWRHADHSARLDSVIRITERLLPGRRDRGLPLMIVWPETVIPLSRNAEGARGINLQRLVPEAANFLLAGAITGVEGSDISPYRNSAYLVSNASGVMHRYDKMRLVPFAEHVPYSDKLPVLTRLAVPSGGVWGYEPGRQTGLLELADFDFQVGTVICFESIFGMQSRQLASSGADVLVVVTQDGWWGDSFGYRQHLEFNRLRAIETRLPVIQVAATGTSALIARSGRVGKKVGWMERGSLSTFLTRRSAMTLYIGLGDWVGLACVVLGFFLILSARIRGTHNE